MKPAALCKNGQPSQKKLVGDRQVLFNLLVTTCNTPGMEVIVIEGETIRTLRKSIQKTYNSGFNWRETASEFGVSPAMAYRIANSDYEPKDARIRHTLGLPALATVPACPVCGGVHLLKSCPSKRRPPRSLWDMSVKALKYAIENREEVER